MTNKEIMVALRGIRKLLYSIPFQADQMMIVSECVRIIDVTMQKLNQEAGDKTPEI